MLNNPWKTNRSKNIAGECQRHRDQAPGRGEDPGLHQPVQVFPAVLRTEDVGRILILDVLLAAAARRSNFPGKENSGTVNFRSLSLFVFISLFCIMNDEMTIKLIPGCHSAVGGATEGEEGLHQVSGPGVHQGL